jgi:uncharacterized membrane protein YhhN
MTMTIFLLGCVALSAMLDWVAVGKGWKKTEYIFKPVTMLLLFTTLATSGATRSLTWIYFGLGLLFSLAGDVFLMLTYARFSERWFIPGLAAFLLAHIAYMIGLITPLQIISPLWGVGIGVILALVSGRILRRILDAIHTLGLRRMAMPVALYGMVITIMLLSALLSMYRLDWEIPASILVSLGAALFYISDVVLAWNKFVRPVRHGRVVNMALYHLGQVLLISGAILHLSP